MDLLCNLQEAYRSQNDDSQLQDCVLQMYSILEGSRLRQGRSEMFGRMAVAALRFADVGLFEDAFRSANYGFTPDVSSAIGELTGFPPQIISEQK